MCERAMKTLPFFTSSIQHSCFSFPAGSGAGVAGCATTIGSAVLVGGGAFGMTTFLPLRGSGFSMGGGAGLLGAVLAAEAFAGFGAGFFAGDRTIRDVSRGALEGLFLLRVTLPNLRSPRPAGSPASAQHDEAGDRRDERRREPEGRVGRKPCGVPGHVRQERG
ncbi:MAG: hypothetical protein HYT80_10605 [Euryarchaeota archaeon]|nr:hypothetical protein [Euryarchaeota archaeon]